jgi:hypothetical protein
MPIICLDGMLKTTKKLREWPEEEAGDLQNIKEQRGTDRFPSQSLFPEL